MFSDAIDAFNQIFTPPFRKVLVRSLALTLAVLALVWLGLDRLATSWMTTPWPWLDTLIAIAAALGLLVGLVFLVAPVSALVAGADGLDCIRAIVQAAPRYLNRDGRLAIEHGYDQAERCRELLRAAGFHEVFSREDLAGIERISGGQWRTP